MKMVPMPEPGDKVVLKAAGDPAEEHKYFAETEGVVYEFDNTDKSDPPVFDWESGDWQVVVHIPGEDLHLYSNVKWDEQAQVWRD